MERMRILLDENVEASVGTFFVQLGYDVYRVVDVLSQGSPDQLIAFTAGVQGLVVVTHDRDFRKFTQLLPVGLRGRYRQGAGCIILSMKETEAAARLAEVIDLIELYYQRSVLQRKRLYVRLTKTNVQYNDQEPDLLPESDEEDA